MVECNIDYLHVDMRTNAPLYSMGGLSCGMKYYSLCSVFIQRKYMVYCQINELMTIGSDGIFKLYLVGDYEFRLEEIMTG